MTPLALEVREYVKAIGGGLTAALALLGGALGDGLSGQEWAGLVAAFVGGFLAVFYLPNRAPVGERADPRISEQHGDAGQIDLLYVLLVVLVVVVLLVVLGVL